MPNKHKKDHHNGLKRGLQNRHVQLIAIAGTIGTGLFMGAGRTISLTGPSILLVYLMTGVFMYLMMRAIGEMLYYDPDQHTFINFITKYLGDGWGYFSGWSYWISLICIGMADITAVAKYVQFWFPNWPAWAIQLTFLVILSLVNLIAVRVFGEVEFWFAMIKIVAIVALIVTGIFMALTGFETSYGTAGLHNLTDAFELFPNGWVSFIMAFQMVFFAYQAIEFIGITTSETENPRQVLPKAIKEIPLRIVIFYAGSLIAIVSIIPWRELSANQSPFVTVFQLAGIKWAAALINFVVLTSAASALNSALYSTGRHLYQIALDSPNKVLVKFGVNKLSRQHVPQNAILVSVAVIAFSALLSALPGISDSFALVAASSSGVYIAIYILTMIAHLKYRQSEDFLADGYLMPAYKILNPMTMVFFVFVFVTMFFQQDTLVGSLGSVVWIVILGLYSQYKFRKKA